MTPSNKYEYSAYLPRQRIWGAKGCCDLRFWGNFQHFWCLMRYKYATSSFYPPQHLEIRILDPWQQNISKLFYEIISELQKYFLIRIKCCKGSKNGRANITIMNHFLSFHEAWLVSFITCTIWHLLNTREKWSHWSSLRPNAAWYLKTAFLLLIHPPDATVSSHIRQLSIAFAIAVII